MSYLIAKRLVIAVLVLGGAIATVILLSGKSSTYRVAAIFDTANGMVGGQQVKIAGVPVGNVNQVTLAVGQKARIVMRIDPKFAPFRADATCTILPEGLISENFVQCNPGSAQSRSLAPGPGGIPTVPLTQTTVPFSLQNVLNVFSLPEDERLRVLINELGIGTFGRGADLNALLRRSNPALVQAQRVLAIVDAQRQELATGIGQTDQVLAALAAQDGNVRTFVARAATVAETTAEHKAALGQSISRLPALLDAVRPGLHSLDRAIGQATPLLHSLRSAAPALTTSTYLLPSFSTAGIPALRSIGSAARTGLPAVRAATPVVRDLRRASAQAIPFADNLDRLLVSTRNAGGLEGILRTLTAFATLFSAYDSVTHLLTIYVRVLPQCLAHIGAPGCTAKYTAPGGGTIPPDDPACGAHSGATWDPPHSCTSLIALARDKVTRRGGGRPGGETKAKPAPSVPPSAASGAASGSSPAPPGSLSALLNYLFH